MEEIPNACTSCQVMSKEDNSERIVKIEKYMKDIKGSQYDGYLVKTTMQEIYLGIDNQQNCCEYFGYFMSEDNLDGFVDSKLLAIRVVDTALNTKKMEEIEGEETSVMFVNIDTSEGVLQFVAYNSHNGYYGHEAIVISEKLNYKVDL